MGKSGKLVMVVGAVAAAVVLFVTGWSVRDAVLSGHGNWEATIGKFAAWTGDASKIALGAMIAAVAGLAVGWMNRSEAKANRTEAANARAEARQDARDAALLEERRAAIVAVLAEGEKATGRIEQLAEKADEVDAQLPESHMEDDFHRAWLELILMAPDIIAGPGAAYRLEASNHMMAYTAWAYERRADAEAGQDVAPRPKRLDQADDRLGLARTAFLLAAIKHLGVHDYANLDIDAALHSLKSGNTPADAA